MVCVEDLQSRTRTDRILGSSEMLPPLANPSSQPKTKDRITPHQQFSQDYMIYKCIYLSIYLKNDISVSSVHVNGLNKMCM